MILFGLIMLFLFFAGVKKSSPDSFTKDKVNFLKPILAIGIVLHHMNNESMVMHEFERWGPMIVGIFFFISGYGLSFRSRDRKYLRNFCNDKIVQKLLLPLSLAFALHYILNGIWTGYSFQNQIFNPGGPSLIPNDWFIYALIYCYVTFWGAMRFSSRMVQSMIIFAGVALFVISTSAAGFARNWWATPFAFCLGFIYQDIEAVFIGRTKRLKQRLMLNISFVITLASLMACSHYSKNDVTTIIAYSTIPLWVAVSLSYYTPGKFYLGRLMTAIGGISFEIYLVHGIVISLLHRITPLSGMLFVLTALPMSIATALMFQKLVDYTRFACSKVKVAICNG